MKTTVTRFFGKLLSRQNTLFTGNCHTVIHCQNHCHDSLTVTLSRAYMYARQLTVKGMTAAKRLTIAAAAIARRICP